ncbi:hypothetical protein BDZ89DRAFT_1137547 [Hymenopellis radicata]|nr:hypothetical protein BDZ89DRAFT_1137547 [Hymenopellis radicata]
MPVELEVFQSNFLVPALKRLYILNINMWDPDVAEEFMIYSDTLRSFATLLSSFPFAQIEDFTIRGAQFGPLPMYVPTEEEEETGMVELASLPVPFQLLQRLKNATKVRIDNPNEFLLMRMLCSQLDMIPKDYRTEEMPPIPIVLANAKELCFEVDTDDQAHRSVLQYLSECVERYVVQGEDGRRVYVGGTPVDVLRLTFPLVSPEQWEKEDWNGTNLARKVVVHHGSAGVTS